MDLAKFIARPVPMVLAHYPLRRRESIAMKGLHAAICLLTLLAAASPGAAQDVLERVVIVQRHGVRPPTKAAAELAKYAEQPWPEWSVPPGELTAHGAAAMAEMGGAICRRYQKAGLLTGSGCPAGVFVWADSGDQRTRASGDAVLKGFGCTAPSQHLAPGNSDPVFDGAGSFSDAEAARAKTETEKRLTSVLLLHPGAYAKARASLQAVLTPNGCGEGKTIPCWVGSGDNVVIVKNGDVRLEGPLAAGSSLSENLLLEYSEGMAAKDVGWGKGAAALETVLPLHNLYADVMRRNPLLAARRSGPLARQIVDLIAGRPSSVPGAAPVPPETKLVIFLGHDTNLSNLAGLFGLSWTLAGQPDQTAPGTAIAFERWRDARGRRSVRVHVLYQTLEDTRALRARTEPASETPLVAGCREAQCPLKVFTTLIDRTLASEAQSH
jgi:4-phytase/acid phosphatase